MFEIYKSLQMKYIYMYYTIVECHFICIYLNQSNNIYLFSIQPEHLPCVILRLPEDLPKQYCGVTRFETIRQPPSRKAVEKWLEQRQQKADNSAIKPNAKVEVWRLNVCAIHVVKTIQKPCSMLPRFSHP